VRKRKAKRKHDVQKDKVVRTYEEEQFVDLIARLIVDITLREIKDQNKKP